MIDSVELSFGDRTLISEKCLLRELASPLKNTNGGGVTAVLGRNGCGKELPDEDTVRFAAGGFPVDAHRRGGMTVFGPTRCATSRSRVFIPGWLTVDRALRDFGLPWDDLLAWFPLFGKLRGTKIRALSGNEAAYFWNPT